MRYRNVAHMILVIGNVWVMHGGVIDLDKLSEKDRQVAQQCIEKGLLVPVNKEKKQAPKPEQVTGEAKADEPVPAEGEEKAQADSEATATTEKPKPRGRKREK